MIKITIIANTFASKCIFNEVNNNVNDCFFLSHFENVGFFSFVQINLQAVDALFAFVQFAKWFFMCFFCVSSIEVMRPYIRQPKMLPVSVEFKEKKIAIQICEKQKRVCIHVL